tara:strand:- start:397 stop:3660 length:3264 start_codon:yes stop_codon:yes gene_type:complete
MIGISENKLNKTEKNKLIKEGPCIFPFKYKWKTHNVCYETDKGPICATEINENQTLKKYGYCLPKKTTKKKLNKSSNKDKDKDKDIKIKSEPRVNMEKPSPPFNESFIYQLTLLENLQRKKNEKMRALAYAKAKKAIKNYDKPINSIDDIKPLPNIGTAIIEKLTQFIETGKIQHLIDANVYDEENKKIGNSSLIDMFTKIYGVGPKNAEKIIKAGITSIDELRSKEDEFLNDKQKIGLKYYDDINKRIPRDEIDEYSSLFQKYFNEAKMITSQSDALFEIVGSYRREAKDSGDIDVIITNKNNNKTIFNKFIELLVENNIILHKLTDGVKQIKILVIGKLSGKPARRIDFMYTTYEEYPFAILYFTGSQSFNTAMRQHALDEGYTMNEHRLENISTKKKVTTNIKSEKDIFKFLKLEYVEPKNRIDLSSLKIIDSKPSATIPESDVKIQISDKFIDEFSKNGIDFLKTQSEKEISTFIRKANLYYHTHSKPLVSDEFYDIIKEYFEEKYPDASVLKEIGAPIEEYEKNKVTLPFEMASMDKIKPNSNALNNWLEKYNNPIEYVASVKLDGVSGLYVYSGKDTPQEKQALFTRGNGKIGQDISYLIPYFKLPTNINIVIRGEFVISKENFKNFQNKANARNAVAGIINSKKVNPHELAFVDFVAYEIIEPILTPSEQYNTLKKIYKNHVCQHTILSELSNSILSDLLKVWRSQSIYDMDGIVVNHNKIYKRTSGNPKHAFAFKMILTDQIAEAKVINVLWNPSKDGYLKPRVQIEPIQLDGVTIQYATGFNASFIEKNNINIGSIIEIIRSGDVIPHITKVIKPSQSPKMPDVPYIWNDTHVDIMLETTNNNEIVLTKNITLFFDGVDGLGPGNIKKIVNSGFNTVSKIIGMSKNDFLTIQGIKEKTANKLYTNIHNKVDNMTLPELISNSNVFGRGFGDKKIELILNTYPDILTSNESPNTKIQKLTSIKGLAQKTSGAFINKIPDFITFINEANLTDKLAYTPPEKITTSHILNDKIIVFTGKRDSDLENVIKNLGGIISNDMKSDVFVLISDDKNSTSSKMKTAKEKNIPIMTINEFKSQYIES